MAWLRARSIGSRLLRTLIASVVGAVAVAWLVWEVSIAPALRDAVGRHQLEVARRAADLIDEFMDRRVDELRRTVQIGRLWEERPEQQRAHLDRMLQLSPLIEEVAITDARGTERIRVSRSRAFLPTDLRDLAGTDTFSHASERKVYIGDVYARGGEPMVTLAVAMPSNAPEAKGVLTAEVSLKTLWDAVAHIRVGTAGHPFVVDRKGTFVAHPDPSRMGMRARDSYHPSVWALVENRARGRTELAYAEVAGLVVSWVLIPQTGMAVVVAEPRRTALATLHHIERLGLALLALSVAGVVITTTWFSRRLSRTIAELAAGADLIARGKLDHSLRIASGDELESLAGQFNGMASQLRASYAALESEVMVKTLDLQALYAVTTPISRTGDVKGVLEEAVEKLIDVTGADAVAIELLSEPPVLVQRGFSGVWPLPPIIPADVEIHAELTRAGARHRRFLDEGFTSAAFVPLLINGASGGVVTLAARTTDQLPPRARELFRAIGHQIAVAVENARLYAETQRAMRELRDKNVELDTFVYSVSHDLKAPVVTIQGMAGLLLDGAADRLAEKDRHYLTRIDASCSHMQALIMHLLALSRVGRDAWTSENVHLNDVVDAVLDDLQAAVGARGVRVTVDDLPVVRAPRVHMHEIFVNLLSNAIKYLGPVAEPSISVGAKHHGDHVELWVSDNGVGIDPAYHGKVFEAFQRLKDVSAEGSGVGLAIVKKIIETAGGRIWVESARGEGATFRFTWPGGGAASPPSATA